MVLKADQERVKTLLTDTITLLCRNGLSFKTKFSVEALIGVTLDEEDVFLVSIKENVRHEKAPKHGYSSGEENAKSSKRGKKVNVTVNRNAKRPHMQSPPQDKNIKKQKKNIVEVPVPVQMPMVQIKEEIGTSDEEREEMARIKRAQRMWEEHSDYSDEEDDSYYEDSDEGEFLPPGHPQARRHFQQFANHPGFIQGHPMQRHPGPMAMHGGPPHGPPHVYGPRHPQPHNFQGRPLPHSQHQPNPHANQLASPQQASPHSQHHPDPQRRGDQLRRGEPHPQRHHDDKYPDSHPGEEDLGPGEVLVKREPGEAEQSEIMYIKEEMEEWPEDEEEPEPDDGSLHPDSMYSSMPHTAAADTSGLPDDHFPLAGMSLVPVTSEEGNVIWAEALEPPAAPQGQYRSRTKNATSTVTSDSTSQDHQQADGEDMGQESLQEEDGEAGMFTVVDYEGSLKKPRKPRSTPIQTELYFCQTCSKPFKSLNAYNIHKDEHKGIYKHVCDECGQGFSSKLKKDNHMRMHTGERFKCDLCQKEFMSKTGLKRHVKTLHDPQKT